HFAMDTDEVYMTTRLRGKDTFFLPFNKGFNHGKGNPPNPYGHKTAYMWEDILTRESLANIIQHFVRMSGQKKEPLDKKTLFFPRYHQLEVVRKLLTEISNKGTGGTYLIQHSAGSGKSNSITWAAYQLIEVYRTGETDKPMFDSVIVVTDRKILDKQISNNINLFSEVQNIVAHADTSADLKRNLENGKRIIITTIQKFPFIVDGIADLSQKNFAVIIDEAHSSQSGTAADNMNRSIGSGSDSLTETDTDTFDWQEAVLSTMRTRKMQGNASYIAFTATPKNSTLERFGTQQPDGTYVPFHLYSMKQAIEEEFILDVLANYTTYKSYYELEKSIEENPLFESARAQKKLRAFVERNPQTIRVKAEIMLDHFLNQVVRRNKLKGKAKAMVATQNIECAIEYYRALQDLLRERGNPFKILIAFSGKKKVNGIELTEDSLNGFAGKDINEKFDTDEYRILVVANKFLTGFDQPKLTAMYIDKKLKDVLAVQALSRLNRAASKYGKKTEDLFILDFFNSTDDMKRSFDPFYTATSLSGTTDISVLDNLRDDLNNADIYHWSEVESFCQKYFDNADASELSPIIDTVAARFNDDPDLTDDDKADFKIKAKQFVKIYGQTAALIPNEVVKWELLFWFLKFLIPKLIVRNPDQDKLDELLDSIDLSTYGLERVKLNQTIELDETEAIVDPQNPGIRSVHTKEEDKDPLDMIIKSFNERYFQGWDATPEEQRVKFVNIARHMQAHPDFVSKFVNNIDSQTRELAFEKIFNEVMNKQRRNELELYKQIAQDNGFKHSFMDSLKRIIGAM
ncbi:MAG: type I restriction endonuclease subunit R, partial [Bacteroidales bacterium]